MEIDYQKQNIGEVIEFLKSIGEEPGDYTDEQLQNMVEDGF